MTMSLAEKDRQVKEGQRLVQQLKEQFDSKAAQAATFEQNLNQVSRFLHGFDLYSRFVLSIATVFFSFKISGILFSCI
jgi:hypothetical protein